jgi:serine/threonine protein kinase/tetratricopeptide (TPR) repeat protein
VAVTCPKCQFDNPEDTLYCVQCGTRIRGYETNSRESGSYPRNSEEKVSFTRTLETPAQELSSGTLFAGRFRIIEELGRGGMGRVYRAFDTKVNEEVALKLIRPEIASDRKTLERFRNELKTARRISHRNVGRMHELLEEKGTHFITMEYVPGEDLKSAIRRFGRLDIAKSLSVAGQICEGLAEAHRLGVVHRDLKPGNIMIDREGNAHILDFGIARSLREKGLTGAGVMIGTPEYVSPEQAEAGEVDHRSDIYSLGVILYEMVTGRVPFEGETPLGVAMKHKSEAPPSPKALNPQLSDDLSRLVLRCLEKDRTRRYQTVEELLDDLRKIEKGVPTIERLEARKPLTAREITVTFRLKKLLIPASALIALLVIMIILWMVRPREEAGPPLAQKQSVAVLPFVDLSPEKNNEHLADGISDALINALSRIEDLRVPGRTSAFFFKGKEQDVREIGQKLNVRTVLEGSVQVLSDRLRVAAQLINVEDGFQLWSEKYDRKMEGIFAIQDDIARAIVDTLKVEILGERQAPLVKSTTENLEAYNLYLQGRYFWNKRGKEDLLKSIDYFEKAIAIDPKYALAYAGLSNAYMTLANNLFLPPDEGYPKAREFALRALEIDEKLADPHSILGGIKRDYEWDFAGAERELKKAIEIDPGNAYSHMTYAILLSIVLGRHEEGIKEVKLARDQDPLAPRLRANVGYLLRFARRYDEALEELKKALEFDPYHTDTYNDLGLVYGETGHYEESVSQFKIAMGQEDHPLYSIKLAVTYAHAGKIAESRKILSELKERAAKEYISAAVLAAAYGALGERNIAFDLLDEAYGKRDIRLTYLKTDPLYDPLRSDPRFAALLKKIGLEK